MSPIARAEPFPKEGIHVVIRQIVGVGHHIAAHTDFAIGAVGNGGSVLVTHTHLDQRRGRTAYRIQVVNIFVEFSEQGAGGLGEAVMHTQSRCGEHLDEETLIRLR